MSSVEMLSRVGMLLWFGSNLLSELCRTRAPFIALVWHGVLMALIMGSGIYG